MTDMQRMWPSAAPVLKGLQNRPRMLPHYVTADLVSSM